MKWRRFVANREQKVAACRWVVLRTQGAGQEAYELELAKVLYKQFTWTHSGASLRLDQLLFALHTMND